MGSTADKVATLAVMVPPLNPAISATPSGYPEFAIVSGGTFASFYTPVAGWTAIGAQPIAGIFVFQSVPSGAATYTANMDSAGSLPLALALALFKTDGNAPGLIQATPLAQPAYPNFPAIPLDATVTFPAPTTTGNTIVVNITSNNGYDGVHTYPPFSGITVTDNANNIYVNLADVVERDPTYDAGGQTSLWACIGATGNAALVVTIQGVGNPGNAWIIAGEFSHIVNYVIAPAPIVAGCTPNSGPIAGGTAITNLFGTDFASGCTVTFGGVSATSVVFVNPTQLTCVTPAHALGAVNIVVANPDSQFGTLVNGYTYSIVQPTMTTVTSSTNPSVFTDPVTFTISVAGTSPPIPATGTIAILDGISPPVPIIMGLPLTAGSVQYTTSSLNTGTRAIVAIYVPQGLFASSSGSVVQVVTPLSGLWTNAPFPGRLALYCSPLAGPYTSSALGAFDPRRDMQIYVDGDLLDIVSFSFDPVNNRYLMFSYSAFDLQGVIQATYHIPDPPFKDAMTSTVPPAALIGKYSIYGA